MTPVLFDLPLRLSDAAPLASLLLDQPARLLAQPVTDEFRTRLAARAQTLAFEAMSPCYASLERDPIHPTAWYICVDGVENQPLLLRIAPSTTPSSGLFPKAILIGRTFCGATELVLNVVHFCASDHDRLLAFADQVNRAFQPKPAGSRPVIRITADNPARGFPLAFEGLRQRLKTTGQNAAAFAAAGTQEPASIYFTAVWAAIRAGWREGFTLHSDTPVAPLPGVRGRPFEVELNVAHEIHLPADFVRGDILEQF